MTEKRVKIESEEEKFAALVAEKVVATLAKGLLPEVRKLREEVELLRQEIASIKASLEQRQKAAVARPEERKKYSPVRDELIRSGFFLLSDLSRRTSLSPVAIVDDARAAGAVVLDAGGDAVIMSQLSFAEFKEVLAEIKERDPEEAAIRAGKFRRIFEALRRGGLLIYRDERWEILE